MAGKAKNVVWPFKVCRPLNLTVVSSEEGLDLFSFTIVTPQPNIIVGTE